VDTTVLNYESDGLKYYEPFHGYQINRKPEIFAVLFPKNHFKGKYPDEKRTHTNYWIMLDDVTKIQVKGITIHSEPKPKTTKQVKQLEDTIKKIFKFHNVDITITEVVKLSNIWYEKLVQRNPKVLCQKIIQIEKRPNI